MAQERQLQVDAWLALLYEDLRARAVTYLHGRPPLVSIRPTELVHEAYLRIARGKSPVNDKGHLFAMASVAMRQVLVDEARARRAAKRGGGWKRLSLEDATEVARNGAPDVLELDELLSRLHELDPRSARIVEMKVFGGFTDAEIGLAVGLGDRRVRQLWNHARAWLQSGRGPSPCPPSA